MNAIRINKVVVVTVLLGMASMSSAAEGTWTRKADMPTKRLCLSTSVVNGKIYAIGGGYSIEGPSLRTVEEYDPATDTWTKKADMPTARLGHSASVANGKIYAIGGDLQKEVSGATVEEYDPATDTWTRKADMPTRRTFLCACAVDGKIYAFGGVTAGVPGADFYPSAVEVYDPVTDTWTRRADIPTARRSMAAASAVDGKIYVIGGVVGDIAGPGIVIVEQYDPGTDTWTRKANMPTGRKALSTCVVSGRIYAIGGGTGMGPAYSTVEEYDTTTNVWAGKSSMATVRWFPASDAMNGKIYAIGGGVDFHVAFSTVEEYDIGLSPSSPDFNGDGIVDAADICIMVEHWLTEDTLCDIAPPPFGDGIVDVQDLILLSEHLFEEIIPSDLIAYWKLNETEGSVAYNSAGDNDGFIFGDPVWRPAEGKRGGTLELDGIDDYILSDYVLNPANGPFSVFAWIKDGASGQAIISQADDNGSGENWLGMDSMNGYLLTGLVPPPLGRFIAQPLGSQTVISDGQWHHVGFVWDGSYRSLYVDGTEVAKDTAVQNPLKSATGDLYIGVGKNLEAGTFFSGLIDDVRIYNKALSAEEIDEMVK